ncbi:MAG TPA: hypothetical protein VFU22_29100 [Roseiflexaceae bacterium]|nr:hypothetical protein [Roseiflexaceae bacterium]
MMIDTRTALLLAHLWRGGNYSYFWAASQAKDSQGDALWKRTFWHNGSGPAELPADEHTQYGAVNLYLGLHPVCQIPQERKRPSGTTYRPHPSNMRPCLEEVAALNTLYAEYDEADFGSKDAILEHIATLPALPSVTIDSGGGYHCYWLLDEPYVLDSPAARERAKDLQAGWVALVGGDNDAKDLSRVLRLPGTLSFKYQPPCPCRRDLS